MSKLQRSRVRAAVLCAAAGVLGLACLAGVYSPAAATGNARGHHHHVHFKAPTKGRTGRLGCASKADRRAKHLVTCDGYIRTHRKDGHTSPLVNSSPTGFGAPQIQAAYNLTGLKSNGRTVAIVDAYDDPNAEADLATYRSTYGLPACTTANGCFTKVNQTGKTSPLPKADYGWAEEISLDLDMVSAACPDCHIALVEASSANDSDLASAVDTAAALPGVVAVSNSYGEAESDANASMAKHYDHPGVAITVSSGDSGYGVEYPAALPTVTSVGGTSLKQASNARGWTETAWIGAGSGCSSTQAKPAWQTDSGCAHRTVADVSSVADPNTGVAVYDTAASCSGALCQILISLGLAQGANGWVQVGGTSASSPVIASVYALAGNTASITGASYAYGHTDSLNDVTSGSNGNCSGSYLCTAGSGYDGPTGLGTPNGDGAF